MLLEHLTSHYGCRTGHARTSLDTRFCLCIASICAAQDATGNAYSALGFSNGFEPRLPGDKKLNPYLRLLPMLAGIGYVSPPPNDMDCLEPGSGSSVPREDRCGSLFVDRLA